MSGKNPQDDAIAVPVSSSTSPARPQARSHLSLENVHGSIDVPHHQASFWEQWRAFVGPAILVSVGYMDPGNWGTDLQGGAQFKYGLLWVVGLASLMAIFMQVIARSEEHTSELLSRRDLVCRLLLEKKKKK